MISVVIPLYNKEKFIADTLNCVLHQTFKKFEVIVVDDGSKDDSVAIVKQFDDQRIKLITKKNGGVSSARNCGIKNANFEFIAFLDADDIWELGYLEDCARLIEKYPDAGLIGHAYKKEKGKDLTFQGLPHGFDEGYVNYPEACLKEILFWTSALVVQKICFKEVGYFNENLTHGEDLEMWYRIAIKYKSVYSKHAYSTYSRQDINSAVIKNHLISNDMLCVIDKYIEDQTGSWEKYLIHLKSMLLKPFLRFESEEGVRLVNLNLWMFFSLKYKIWYLFIVVKQKLNLK